MDLLSAIRSIRLFEKKESLTPLTTIWGESLDPENVLSEYPRPQMVRPSNYQILNGYWNYAFTNSVGTVTVRF